MNLRSEVSQKIHTILVELFEVDLESISDDSLLYEDLDIDSIDAVDLIIELKSYTGKNVDPEDFSSVRTVGDVVNIVSKLV